MAASNTREAFRECVGKRVVGVMFDALPQSTEQGYKTFVFDDGTGFTVADNGAAWQETAGDVSAAAKRLADRLAVVRLRLSGAESGS